MRMVAKPDPEANVNDLPSISEVADLLRDPLCSAIKELSNYRSKIRTLLSSVYSAIDCLPRLLDPFCGFGSPGAGKRIGGKGGGGMNGDGGEKICESYNMFQMAPGSESIAKSALRCSCNEAWKLSDNLVIGMKIPERGAADFAAMVSLKNAIRSLFLCGSDVILLV